MSRTQNFFIAFPESTIIGGHLGADSFCLRSQPWPWRGFEVTRAENRPFFGPFLKFSNGCSSAQECDCRVKYASSGAAWPKFSKKKKISKIFFKKFEKRQNTVFDVLAKTGACWKDICINIGVGKTGTARRSKRYMNCSLQFIFAIFYTQKCGKKPENRQKMT